MVSTIRICAVSGVLPRGTLEAHLRWTQETSKSESKESNKCSRYIQKESMGHTLAVKVGLWCDNKTTGDTLFSRV